MRWPTDPELARLLRGIGDALLAFLVLNWAAIVVTATMPQIYRTQAYLFVAIEATIAAGLYRVAARLQGGGGSA